MASQVTAGYLLVDHLGKAPIGVVNEHANSADDCGSQDCSNVATDNSDPSKVAPRTLPVEQCGAIFAPYRSPR